MCKDQRAQMTPELRRRIIARDKSICQHCGKLCNESEIEIDHKTPISKGGKTVPDNLQVLCRNCNRKKGNKMPDDIYDNDLYMSHAYSSAASNKTIALQSKIVEQRQKDNNADIKSTLEPFGVKWIKVASSNVDKLYYNFALKNLYIMFKDGSIYVYYNVDKSVFMEFLSAPSKGAFVKYELMSYRYSRIKSSDVQSNEFEHDSKIKSKL